MQSCMTMTAMLLALHIAALSAGLAAVPSKMMEVRALGACGAPKFACVHTESVAVPVPKAGASGQVLIKMNGSSVNPSDVDTVEYGGCMTGCGADLSGTVVVCQGCNRLKVGDEVWGLSSPAYAEYVLADEQDTGLRPMSISAQDAATIPEVGLTSLFSLKRTAVLPGQGPLPGAGSPWNKTNLTVVITAGSGGTGSIGIELAKAWGATHIATATSGAAGIAFVKSLGATFVTDYKVVDIFDALPDNSVDIVYDNYGADGTADKAMPKIRPGGAYLMMPHGQCFESKSQKPPCLSANPKPGVSQVNYDTSVDFEKYALAGLDELKDLVNSGGVKPNIDQRFSLSNVKDALAYSAGPGSGGVGDHIGKISITF